MATEDPITERIIDDVERIFGIKLDPARRSEIDLVLAEYVMASIWYSSVLIHAQDKYEERYGYQDRRLKP